MWHTRWSSVSIYSNFFFLIFHSKFFFSYIFREKINVVSGRAWGGKGQKRKKTTGFFFHVMLFLSLALSSKIGIVVWFMFCFFVCFFSNPNLIIGKSLDLRFCNSSSSNGATVKSFPSYSKGCSFSVIIIILLGTFCESKECAAQKRIHFFSSLKFCLSNWLTLILLS